MEECKRSGSQFSIFHDQVQKKVTEDVKQGQLDDDNVGQELGQLRRRNIADQIMVVQQEQETSVLMMREQQQNANTQVVLSEQPKQKEDIDRIIAEQCFQFAFQQRPADSEQPAARWQKTRIPPANACNVGTMHILPGFAWV